jgi:hypothetical protein
VGVAVEVEVGSRWGRGQMYWGFDFVVVLVVPKPSCNKGLSFCTKTYANKGQDGQISEGRQRKNPHVFMRSRTLESFGLVYIRNDFIIFIIEQNKVCRDRMLTPRTAGSS